MADERPTYIVNGVRVDAFGNQVEGGDVEPTVTPGQVNNAAPVEAHINAEGQEAAPVQQNTVNEGEAWPEDFDTGIRANLETGGVTSLRAAQDMSDEEILSIDGVGRQSLKAIRNA